MKPNAPALVGADGRTPLRASMSASMSADGPRSVRMSGDGAEPYRAASATSQELASFYPALLSTDGAYLLEKDTINARVAHILRNNGWAAGLSQRFVDQAIGSQVRLAWHPDLDLLGLDPSAHSQWVRDVERQFRAWAFDPRNLIDVTGANNLSGLLGAAFRSRIEAGECLIIPHWIEREDTPYRTCLQIISPDRLSNPQGMPDTLHLRAGIERDAFGKPGAYHIRKAHPGDTVFDPALGLYEWEKIERTTDWGRLRVIHFFESLGPEQTRGISLLAPVVEEFVMQSRYARSELQAALVNAILGAWIESAVDPTQALAALGGAPGSQFDEVYSSYAAVRDTMHTQAPVRLDGVRLPILPVGDKINFGTVARPHAQYADFEGAVLRKIASAVGLSYEQLTQDWSKTNYSSARAALLEAWKFLKARKEHFAQGVATPIFALWLEDAIDAGVVTLPDGAPDFWDGFGHWMRCRWTLGPGRGWVDPVKEAQAALIRVNANLSTMDIECAEQGHDYEEVMAQRAKEQALLTTFGLQSPEMMAVASDSDEQAEEERPQER